VRGTLIKHFIFIFLFFAVSALAGERESELVNKLQKKFETINNLTVDVVLKSQGEEILSGLLSYKKENQFNLDLKSNLIISDGSTIWNYNRESKKVIINEVDKTDPSFFSFNKIVNDYPSKCDLSSERNGNFDVLIFVPRQNSNLGFNKAKVWIDKSDLINKVELTGSGSEKTEIHFSNYKLNQNLSDSKFKFNPPKGSSIIDLR
jgi:outer membrane lipoprotein carrier protein